MHPEFFSVLGHPIHTYGVTAATGFMAGFFYAKWQARATGQDDEQAADLIFYGIVFGIIGARLLYILVNLAYFTENPLDIVRIDKGGLVWYGGPLLGVPLIWLVMRRKGLSVMAYSDLVMPASILALGIGRLGCLAAGCCYGRPAEVPWAIEYPVGSTPYAAYLGAALHPTPLYELAACLSIVGGAVWLGQRKKVHGEPFWMVLSVYAVARSVIEIFRGDKVRGFVAGEWLSTSQFISIFVGALCVACWIYFRKHPLPSMKLDDKGPGERPGAGGGGARSEERAVGRRQRRKRRAGAGA